MSFTSGRTLTPRACTIIESLSGQTRRGCQRLDGAPEDGGDSGIVRIHDSDESSRCDVQSCAERESEAIERNRIFPPEFFTSRDASIKVT